MLVLVFVQGLKCIKSVHRGSKPAPYNLSSDEQDDLEFTQNLENTIATYEDNNNRSQQAARANDRNNEIMWDQIEEFDQRNALRETRIRSFGIADNQRVNSI